jgi:predicted naringenin-chalcone synthase
VSIITKLGTKTPAYKVSQMQLFEHVKTMHADSEVMQRSLRFMYSASGIDTKYVCIKDLEPNAEAVLLNKDVPSLSVQARQAMYDDASLPLCIGAIDNCLDGQDISCVTHLITVSCTGLSAPGLDVRLVEALQMRSTTQRTSINFMGCYAAIHGMKQAHQIVCSNGKAKVLVVCIELCSLHFQKDLGLDNVTSTIVFADGCAAMLVEADHQQSGLVLKDFFSELKLEGAKDMAWHVTDCGYTMTLSAHVPEHLKNSCYSVISDACKYYSLSMQDISYCVHPGGRKILEAVEQAMTINKEALAASYEVLKKFGNMSSPTILFVLKALWRQLKTNNSAPQAIVGMAFGPGLALETFYAEYRP